jgi:hypothetical protein
VKELRSHVITCSQFLFFAALCLAADMKALHPDDMLCCCFPALGLADTYSANFVGCWLQT